MTFYVLFDSEGWLSASYARAVRAPVGAMPVTQAQLGQLMGRELRLVGGVLVAV